MGSDQRAVPRLATVGAASQVAGLLDDFNVGFGTGRTSGLVGSMPSDGAAMHYAAFLRGINLGGRRVKSEQLCGPFEQLGFHDVASFLASGNVSFGTDEATELEARIETALEAALGYPVETFVRTAAEVADISTLQPFDDDVVAASSGKLQVTFLRRAPSGGAVEDALAHASADDRLVVVGREWYWLPSGGVSQSSLDVRALERILGRGTTRTITTVARLRAKLASDRPA